MQTNAPDGKDATPWLVTPAASGHRLFRWADGAFETAGRKHTASVEGVIRSSSHLIMATLKGGARRHEFVTAAGDRFSGGDRAGSVSFLPAGCERRLALKDVAWEWASIALPANALPAAESIRPLSEPSDPFLFGMLSQFSLLLRIDGALDTAYCDAMTFALSQYLSHGRAGIADVQQFGGLSPRRLRSVCDYVDANLVGAVRICDMAGLVGLSEGHFHRAFRSTTGKTPLQFINERRIMRAAELLAARPSTIIEVAMKVGFSSPSHFARTFRRIMGVNPNSYRRDS